MSAGTIVLVEDNPITRKMLRVALELEGYEVVDCPDGATALQRAASRRPDLLILDYVLPDMDGLQLLADLRRQAGAPEVPAIVVTGMVSRLEELRARSGGATQLLAKPVEPSQLLDVVRAQLAPAAKRTSGERILVVDDEPLNLKLSVFRLKRAGYEVETASGGEEALSIARRQRPDAILTDVMMPSMDGFTLCREARRDPALSRIPIILASSAYVEEADRQLARQMGANALVVRTPDLHDAMAAIEASLRGTMGASPPSTSGDVTALHRERLQVQLERQTARNEDLLRQAAIQATALSIIRGLSEVLAQPRDVPQILGDVLVHCLDAAGLSTGLLYMAEPGGEHRLQAHFGIPAERKADAEALFGHPHLMRRIAESGKPVALASDSQDLSEESWIGFARSLALQFGQTVALGQSLKRLAASESRYRALMEHANDAILILDPAARVLEVNRETERLLARRRAEIVGRHYDEFVVPDEQADSERRQEQLLVEGTLRVESRQLVRPDGGKVSVEVSASLVKLGGESVVLTILRDITERQAAEEARRRSEARMKSVLDAALDAMVMMDERGHITSWNRRAEALFGWSRDEAVGRALADLIIPPRYREAHWRGLARFLDTGEGPVIGRRIELSAVRRDGSEFPVELTVTALKESGAYLFSAFIADITERKSAEEALRKAQQRLQHVVSSSPAVLYTLRVEDGVLLPTWTSANIERFAGYTQEEVAGPGWWADRVHPDDREKVMSQVLDLLEQGWAVREYRFRHKTGTYRWVRDEQILVRHGGEPGEVVGSWSDVTERQEAELRLKESEEQYRLLFENNPHPMWVHDIDTLAFLAVNDAALRHYGYTRDEFLSMTALDIRPPEEVAAFKKQYEERRATHGSASFISTHPYKHRKKDGTIMQVDIAANAIAFAGREARLVLATDVTEKQTLEKQLVRAQKMEAVGQLAGGVAHDFNNLLGVITGYSELLMRELPAESRERKRGEEIKRAADRAAALTRQLLAFSRRQVLQPKVLDLNEVVVEVEKMIRRLISENIQIVTVAGTRLGKVRADAGQVEQVLMNLAINARDAMPSGGRLVIETGNVELDETYVRTNPEARAGA
ncbi:MAG: hypothetical protein DMF78_15225 [Acidobacteria bacterium]|nr:MAG: hypothetical protein DMF78_15225 [Acidobacteriota bacterium]